MPTETSAEEIRQGRAALDELAEAAGHDPKSIEITVLGRAGQFLGSSEIEQLEQAGADRVNMWLQQTEGPEAIAEIEEIAHKVQI